jgi:hypothetical protein
MDHGFAPTPFCFPSSRGDHGRRRSELGSFNELLQLELEQHFILQPNPAFRRHEKHCYLIIEEADDPFSCLFTTEKSTSHACFGWQ